MIKKVKLNTYKDLKSSLKEGNLYYVTFEPSLSHRVTELLYNQNNDDSDSDIEVSIKLNKRFLHLYVGIELNDNEQLIAPNVSLNFYSLEKNKLERCNPSLLERMGIGIFSDSSLDEKFYNSISQVYEKINNGLVEVETLDISNKINKQVSTEQFVKGVRKDLKNFLDKEIRF